MDTPEMIERSLERLVPRGFSREGEASLMELIDELAGEDSPERGPRWGALLGWSGGLAAAFALGGGLIFAGNEESGTVPLAGVEDMGVELMAEAEGVVSAEPDSTLLVDPGGDLHQAWHVQVVNEERVRDLRTGYEVRITRPRDELVLLPVTSF